MSYDLVDAKPIHDLCKIIDCEHKTAPYVEESEFLVVRTSNVRNGQLVMEDMKFTTEEGFEEWTQRATPVYGDVLFTREAPAGESCLVPEDKKICMGQRMVLLRPNRKKVDPLFLSLILATEKCKFDIYRLSIGSTVSRINISDIKKLKVASPPLHEQQKIAQILSTWDQAISATEKLLKNSQEQKKALMQQLLTGKKRLLDENGVEFSDEWQTLSLDSLFFFKKGKGLSKDSISETGQNKCILYGELYTKYSEVIDEIVSKTDSSEATLSMKGDILIPSSTTTSGIDLANATALLEENILLGGDINILRPKGEISSEFIAYLLTHIKKYEIASRAQGITIIHLYGSDLKDIEVQIPVRVQEQKKIAKFLSIVEKEMNVLQGKIVCLKKEKKALMQQLLTGKKRVKVAA